MIEKIKDTHKGERCFVLGNGPSLNDVDMGMLKNEITFGTNRIYLKEGFTPTYYVCVNPLVYEQFGDEIDAIDTTKFISERCGCDKDVYQLDTYNSWEGFYSPEESMWEGSTVTFIAMQLAYYMGFKEVILVGVDHYFGDYKVPHLEAVATGPDENHFDPSYFSNGTRWNYPNLPGSELAYNFAKMAFEKDGRRIINASANTKLRVFPLLPLYHVMNGYRPRVSAIVSAYKAKEFLVDCFDDLKNQTEEVEIVVVCQKGSWECETAYDYQMLRKYPITIVETENVPTVYHAWNIGARAAAGKYLTNANTDDRHHPNAYWIMANLLDVRPDIDLVYHDCYITWKANQTYAEFINENEGKALKAGRWEDEPGLFMWHDYDRSLLAQGCFVGPQPMWRANLHQRHGWFLDSWKSAGDYEFWLRIAEKANMYHIPQVLGLYHARLDGIELGDPATNQREARQAVIMSQEPGGLDVSPNDGYVRLTIGDKWIVAGAGELFALMDRLKAKYVIEDAIADEEKLKEKYKEKAPSLREKLNEKIKELEPE